MHTLIPPFGGGLPGQVAPAVHVGNPMIRKLSFLFAASILLLNVRAAGALEYRSLRLLNHAWPDAPAAKVGDIGRGVGVVISTCNSGRLMRPSIYNELDPWNGDKLFLPATCGIINASRDFDPSHSVMTFMRPESSHIETTLVGSVRELAPATRRAILSSAKSLHIKPPTQFAVSDIMMQMLVRDSQLLLVANTAVDDLSKEIAPVNQSERLFRRFVTYLNAVAARENTALV